MTIFYKTTLCTTLVTTALFAGLAVSMTDAVADDASNPQAHSDSFGAAISDTLITAKVKAKLMGEDSLKQSDINVTTTNSVVTLTGSASSSNAKSIAEAATKSIEGVKSVDNSLKTPASSPTAAKVDNAVAKTERVISDSWISTKVKSDLLASSFSKGMDVDVQTIHGVVVLRGNLANQDAIDHVKDIAEQVDGVKSVNTSALTITGK